MAFGRLAGVSWDRRARIAWRRYGGVSYSDLARLPLRCFAHALL
jgi:hypothetical protein